LFIPYNINKYDSIKSPIEIIRTGTLLLILIIRILAIRLTKKYINDTVLIKVVILEVLNAILNDESNVIRENTNIKSIDISLKYVSG
tara:strand:- start:953 stop:1213 length:261 start_codon:yes stop_codon:yes gene_type:complete